MTVRGEVEREPDSAGRPRGEPAQAQLPAGRDEQERQPEAAERAGETGELGQGDGSRTNTAARAV